MRGDVLELGAGTGSNFRYMPQHISWTGVDKNPHVAEGLLDEAARSGFTPNTLNLHQTNISEYLRSLPDESVDNILATQVLCTMPEAEVRSILKDIWRVLKPAGKYYFVEKTQQSAPWSWLQHVFNPIRRFVDGRRLNVPIAESIYESGFGVYMEYWPSAVDHNNSRIGIELVQCQREAGQKINVNTNKCNNITNIHGLSPVIAGIAKKPGVLDFALSSY